MKSTTKQSKPKSFSIFDFVKEIIDTTEDSEWLGYKYEITQNLMSKDDRYYVRIVSE